MKRQEEKLEYLHKGVPVDPLQKSDWLDQKMKENPGSIASQISALGATSKRLARFINLVAVSLAVEVIVIFVVGFLFIRQQQNIQNVEVNRAFIARNCELTNQYRKDNRVLWQFILDLPPDPNRPNTLQTEKNRAAFIQFLDKTFAETDCSIHDVDDNQ